MSSTTISPKAVLFINLQNLINEYIDKMILPPDDLVNRLSELSAEMTVDEQCQVLEMWNQIREQQPQ
jgi:hypothetical protein